MRLNESLTRGTSTFDVAIVLYRLHWCRLHRFFGPGLFYMFNVFRNAQITLRILIICASYPFLLCLCFCSTYVLTLHILFTLTSFWFWHAFCFIRTAIRAAGGFQATACQKGGCSTRSYSSIFHRFYFCSQATFILGESSETILLFVDSGGSEVGHVPLDVRNGWA